MRNCRPINGMKCFGVAILCSIPLLAEPVLLIHDQAGKLLRQAPAVLRPEGMALAPREALYGAASAVLLGLAILYSRRPNSVGSFLYSLTAYLARRNARA